MSDDFDLRAYFERIGYGGAARPDLTTLTDLHARHVASIPFEALDPLLGRPVRLDPAALQAKLVNSRRGGYCFEQNALFKAALEAIGFPLTPLGGRVVWMSPPGAPLGPRSHMLLKVELPEGPHIADVGFGAHLLDAPLRFETDVEHKTPRACYRLTRDGDLFSLAVRQPDDWRRAYVFDLTPQLPSDYAMANWFASTNPQMPFASTLIVERLAPEARYNLVNTRFTEKRRDGTVAERTLGAADDLAATLDRVFDIEPPAPARAIFAKIAGA